MTKSILLNPGYGSAGKRMQLGRNPWRNPGEPCPQVKKANTDRRCGLVGASRYRAQFGENPTMAPEPADELIQLLYHQVENVLILWETLPKLFTI